MTTRVFGPYDQAELDLQYDNQRSCPEFRTLLDQAAALSAAAQSHCTERDVRWGEHPDAKLDIYRPAGPGPFPVILYLHGGAWLGQNKEESAFAVPTLLDAGCMYVALGFPRASQVPFADMMQAVREGVAWVMRNIADFGGDAGRLVLMGHSSGSHLVTQCLIQDWRSVGLPSNDFAGAVLVSGLGHLEPVRLSYRNQRLHLTPEHVQQYSLLTNEPTAKTPVLVAVAEHDTDEFRRQSAEVAAYWQARGLLTEFLQIESRNHFDVILDLCDPNTRLTRAVLSLVNGSAACPEKNI